jgi:hypothetical protein
VSARELNRRMLLFAARTRASVRPLRSPRVAVPLLLRGVRATPRVTVRGARAAAPVAGRGARGAVALGGRGARGLAALVLAGARHAARAAADAYRQIDFDAFRRATLMACALAGGVLLIAADFSSVREVTVLTVTRKHVHGGPEHYYALAVLGAIALPLAWGAGSGRSRPAMRGLLAIGAVALAVSLAVDLPQLSSTEGLGRIYDDVGGGAGIGFSRELGGALLLALSGALLLWLTPSGDAERRRARRTVTVEPSPGSAA